MNKYGNEVSERIIGQARDRINTLANSRASNQASSQIRIRIYWQIWRQIDNLFVWQVHRWVKDCTS
jgi:hypothetical protein